MGEGERASIIAIQEHSVGGLAAIRANADAAKHGRERNVGPTDPEHVARKSGGVGLLTKLPVRSVEVQGRTAAYKDAEACGRLKLYELDLAATCMVLAVVYVWIGAMQGNEASERTEDLVAVLCDELAMHKDAPTLITGDLNGDLCVFPTISKMISEQGWCDVGAQASMWG